MLDYENCLEVPCLLFHRAVVSTRHKASLTALVQSVNMFGTTHLKHLTEAAPTYRQGAVAPSSPANGTNPIRAISGSFLHAIAHLIA